MDKKLIIMLLAFTFGLAACGSETVPTEALTPPKTTNSTVPDPTDLPDPTEIPEETPVLAVKETTEEQSEKPVDDTSVETVPKVLLDDLGRKVTLNGPAQRIVTLGPSSLESLFAIGAGSQIVGREEFSTYPDEALQVTSVGSLWGELPSETILALEPDLVIAPEIISPEQIQTLEELGLNVYFQANPVEFDGLWENLRDLAVISGHEDEAEALITDLNARVEAVLDTIEPISDLPSVFYELDATDPQNPYTIGGGTMIDTIIRLAGGHNIGAVLEGQYAPISSEEVITQNPEVILLADAPYGITPELVAERAGWDVIQAVQNGAVFEFDPFLVSVPGPRLVEGLEIMAKILHPDAFE